MDEESFRGPQPLQEMGEEGVEYAPSEENDFSYQLGEKIRSQAQRLAKLEQYRLLCENRILELAPEHPLPVLPEHLGQTCGDASQEELHQAYQKIARLEQQLSLAQVKVPLSEFHNFPASSSQLSHGQLQELYSALYGKAQQLIGEKEELEESLRTEVLQTEEQRAYIEALKQALEVKMEELGVRSGGIDAYVELTQVRAQVDQIRRDSSRQSATDSTVRELQQEVSRKNRELAEAQAHSEAVSRELDEVTTALQQDVEELSKLEEEKSALLDYVQEKAVVEKQLEEAKKRAERELTAEKERHEKTMKRLEAAEERMQEAMSEREEEAQGRVKSLESQVQSLSEQLKSLSGKNQQLQMNNSTLLTTLQETQSELDSLRATYTALADSTKAEKEALIVANTKIRELSEQSRSLAGEVKVYEERIAGYDDLIEQLNTTNEERADGFREKQEAVLRENITLKQKTRELEADLVLQKEDWKQRIHSLENENEELKATLETLQAQFNRERESLGSRLHEQRQTTDSEALRALQSEVRRLTQSLTSAQSRLEDANEEHNLLKSQLEQAERDIRNTTSQVKDREKKLAETIASNEALKSNLDSVQADLDRISSDTQTMADEAFQARQRASDTLQQHGEELKLLRKAISQSGNVISVFAGNLRAVSSASVEYSAVLSESFREMIGKWGEWEEGDSGSTAESVLEWVRVSVDELEALVRRVVELKSDVQSLGEGQQLCGQRLHELDTLEREVKSKEANLTREVDGLMDINQSLKRENELAYQRIESLTADNVKSRREVQTLADELARAKDQVAIYSVDSIKWKQTGEQEPSSQKGLEEKVALLVREKKELELLLARLQNAVPSNTLQRVFLEMMKVRNELEESQREYIRLENLLLAKEAEMRLQTRTGEKQQATALRREVESFRQQLAQCEAQVSVYKRQMAQLESELQDTERVERRRFALQEESERNVVLLQEQLFRRNKEATAAVPREETRANMREDFSVDAMKEEFVTSPQSCQSIESRMGRLAVRENRPRLTIQDKLSQAKVELSQLKRRPPL